MVPMCTIGMDGPMCTLGMDGPHMDWETTDTGEEGAEKEGVSRHVHVCNKL